LALRSLLLLLQQGFIVLANLAEVHMSSPIGWLTPYRASTGTGIFCLTVARFPLKVIKLYSFGDDSIILKRDPARLQEIPLLVDVS
jgi:hypothetical protein